MNVQTENGPASSAVRWDEPLVQQAQQGNERALNLLIRRYLPAVGSRARRFAGAGLEHEDLVQEGLIGLISAVRSYDPGGCTSFRSYSRLCIDRSMISALRLLRGKKRIPGSKLVSISDDSAPEFYPLADSRFDPQAALVRQDESDLFRYRIFRCLSPFERRVLSGYLGGATYGEIARRLNVTAKAVDNAMWRIRRKLR